MTLPKRLLCPHHCQRLAFHRAFHRWSLLAVRLRALGTGVGGPTASPGGQTPLGTGAGGPTVSPGGQTTHRIGAGGPTTSPGDPTARPCAAPPSPPSTASRVAPTTSAAAPSSQLYPLHYSRRPRVTREPPAPPLHQQSPPAKAVPVAPPVNPHPMTTRVKRGFRLLADRLTLSATSASTLSPVPSSVRATLIDPNWHRAMEEEFTTLIANNTWDLVPRPVGSNVVTDK
jgi:hypothetical protein